jgi:flagellar motor component MotA
MSKKNILGIIIWIATLVGMTNLGGMRVFVLLNIPAALWVLLGIAGALLLVAEQQQTRAERLRTISKAGWMSGVISFVVGLIIVLSNLDEPRDIGPNLAVALISILYGAIVSLVCNTLALRHEAKTE